MELLNSDRAIKVALVGDARVGKSSLVSRIITGSYLPVYNPTLNYKCTPCSYTPNHYPVTFDVWDISGSHSTPKDRAEWLKGSDAAIIMVDPAQKSSFDNAVTWYREILSANQNPTKLPILLYAEKTYPGDEQDEVDLETITWLDEMGAVQFFRTPYIDEPQTSSETLRRDQYYDRPFEWILQRITGDPDVHMKNNYPSDYISSPSWQAELRESERQEEEYRRQNGIPSDEDL